MSIWIKEKSEAFVFYETFALTLDRIKSDKEFRVAVKTLINYWLYWKLPEKIESDRTLQLMENAVPLIAAAKKRRKINKENWEKWGRPKQNSIWEKNRNITETKPNDNQNKTKTKPKQNLDVDVDVDVDKEVDVEVDVDVEKDVEVDKDVEIKKENIKEKKTKPVWLQEKTNWVDWNNIVEGIIELAKKIITKCWWVYDSKNETKFANLILKDNDIINRRQEHYKCTIPEFIVNTIQFSYAPYNFANKIDSLFKLYYNYKSVYTTAISNPNENRNIKHTFYINNYFWNKKYDEKKQAIIEFVTKNIPLPR